MSKCAKGSKQHPLVRRIGICLSLWAAVSAMATETEHLGLRILPAPEGIAVDGDAADWNPASGIFVCGDVENRRDDLACWFHAAYDAKNLYILARWVDLTPLSNPGSTAGDNGWNGDCLQVRLVVHDGDAKRDMPAHLTAWRGRDGADVIDISYFGGKVERPQLRDAKQHGARQAFRVLEDGRGYVQEMAVPWALLAEGGFAPVPGERISMTVEPNFNMPGGDRITIKDLFRPGVAIDRIFTFNARRCWGFATFAKTRDAAPEPVRLSDGRLFPVTLVAGAPVVDWGALAAAAPAEGVVTVPLDLPEKGFVSLNLFDAEGRVARQLLTCEPLAAGRHEIPWDGLATPSHTRPGATVAPGTYRWEAIRHGGIGLELVGWACHAGRSPFATPGGGWGGDQGHPAAVAAAGDRVFLGWGGSESGRAVVAVDLEGGVVWRHKRGGFGNAHHLAADHGVLYVNDRQQGENVVYRLTTDDGVFSPWAGSSEATLDLTPLLAPFAEAAAGKPDANGISGMDAAGGRLYLAYGAGGVVLALDGATGRLVAQAAVDAPGDLEVGSDGEIYVVSAGQAVLRFDASLQKRGTVVSGLAAASGIALDAAGSIYVGLGGAANQVQVFDRAGKPVRRVGRPGGRPLLGPWQREGMRFIHALRVSADGRLWVAEHDDMPRRFSMWDAATGAFVREFFGPTDYGAVGGAISPLDPLTLIGQGCEWRIDPATGRADCVGVFHRERVHVSRFGLGPDGKRLYAAVAADWHGFAPVYLYERLAPGAWKLRTRLSATTEGEGHAKRITGLCVWADANDDGAEQPQEVKTHPVELGGWITGWYMPMTRDLAFGGSRYRLAPASFTACGAPVYDPSRAQRLPCPDDVDQRGGMGAPRGHGSEGGRLMLYNGHYGKDHSDFQCFDTASGKLIWTYPNTFVGVHGGHRAPSPARGLIRAAYDIVGSVPLPPPVGDLFAIPTDKGEWHLLTGRGFYLTHLFQSDPVKRIWPELPLRPGIRVDDIPSGGGTEDFGGSITLTAAGDLYVQAGQNAFVAFKATGLDTVRAAGAGTVTLTPEQRREAEAIRGRLLQAEAGLRTLTIPAGKPAFSGDLTRDFGRAPLARFGAPGAGVAVAAAVDATRLHLGWEVEDATPWRNGATEAAVLYTYGDTVDFQLGTDPAADPARAEAVAGDLRLSIGNLGGKPTAVLYRRVSGEKKPRTFFSGVVRDGYTMEYVGVVPDADIRVTVGGDQRRYTVEAAVPLAALGLDPKPEVALRGDFGATFSDAAGADTEARLHWSNQAVGIVADEVHELMMEPRNWGELRFAP